MMLPQHLLTLINTSEDVAIVVDNAKQPVTSVTEAYRTNNSVNRPLQPNVSMDSTLPTLPRSRLNQSPSIPPLCSARKTKISSRKQMKRCSAKSLSKRLNAARIKSISRWDSESIVLGDSSLSSTSPPLCSARKTKISSRKQMKRCSAKSLSKRLNAARIKSISRWDSESIVLEDSSLSSTSPEQQQTLSGLATQKFHSRPTLGRTNSMDKTNHRSALPLRLPRRRESVQDLDTATMIDEVLGELSLIDFEDEEFATESTTTQSLQLPAPSC
jgi:hypothetical protein